MELNKEHRNAADWKKNKAVLGLEQLMWRKRIVAMFRFIKEGDKSVMDLGAGNMHLKKILSSDVRYYPVDVEKKCKDTILCDFNKREFPNLKVDVVVCAGVLEYMKEPQWFLDNLLKCSRKIILSYKGREKFADSMLYTQEIIDYMRENGFCITEQNSEYLEYWTLIACFEKMVPENLKDNIACTGCGSCSNICSKDAIEMRYDKEGFLKPIVDKLKCISCGECVEVCPALKTHPIDNNSKPTCYAAWAEERLRRKSSSGGVFSVLAELILKSGGKVYGAEWQESMFCHHVGIVRQEEIGRLRYSKYVQSNTEYTYREVKADLERNLVVLYVGCPCQIAGLRTFLGDMSENQNLITVDLICFCSPSNILFRRYLEENYGIKNIEYVNFRDKAAGWSSASCKIKLKNGIEVFPKREEDAYQKAFHGVLARRQVCMNCMYTNFPRQGDITLGDFWGIDKSDSSWNDGNGTSLIFGNSEKGKKLIEKIESVFARIEKVPAEWAMVTGNRILSKGPVEDKNKEYFQYLLKKRDFNTAVKWALDGLYDVGVVCLSNYNIGNNLTNYALFRVLTDLGYMVAMINVPDDCKVGKKDRRMFLSDPYPGYAFARNYKDKVDVYQMNDKCGMFLTASDQLFRSSFIEDMNFHSCLDWVYSSKYKFSYATSFGTDVFEDNGIKNKVQYLLKRFQKISVREKSGVALLEKEFGIKSEQVLDPVFLCDKKYYEEMANIGRIRLPKKNYTFAYILDLADTKENILNTVANQWSNGEHLSILDIQLQKNDTYRGALKTLPLATIEEWVASIKNSKFFITDSFHGVCFAIILKKQFCVVFDKENWRGYSRLQSILEIFHLEDRIVANIDEYKKKDFLKDQIDYKKVTIILEREKEKSMNWLHEGLMEAVRFNGKWTAYDFLLEQYAEMKKQEQQNIKTRSELFFSVRNLRRNIKRERNGEEMEIVGWGAGNCFMRNYEELNEFCSMKYVCDSDPEKWGTVLKGNVKCISPKQLSEMIDILVLVMVDNAAVSIQIINSLLDMGITNFEHIENWLKYIQKGQ